MTASGTAIITLSIVFFLFLYFWVSCINLLTLSSIFIFKVTWSSVDSVLENLLYNSIKSGNFESMGKYLEDEILQANSTVLLSIFRLATTFPILINGVKISLSKFSPILPLSLVPENIR